MKSSFKATLAGVFATAILATAIPQPADAYTPRRHRRDGVTYLERNGRHGRTVKVWKDGRRVYTHYHDYDSYPCRPRPFYDGRRVVWIYPCHH